MVPCNATATRNNDGKGTFFSCKLRTDRRPSLRRIAHRIETEPRCAHTKAKSKPDYTQDLGEGEDHLESHDIPD